MTHTLITSSVSPLIPRDWLQPDGVTARRDYKDNVSRVRRYEAWLVTQERTFLDVDLARYRDTLLKEGLAPSSVSIHLSSIRARYQSLLVDNDLRDRLYAQTPLGTSPADRRAYVEERLRRVENAIDPRNVTVRVVTHQDRADDEHIRLSAIEAERLLALPNTTTLMGLRDRALLAMLLGLGLREQELCDLVVDDLEREFGGELSVMVREGKGKKQRLIPYGEHLWALRFTHRWLAAASTKEEEPVFKGFYRGEAIRPTSLSTRAVQQIVGSYAVESDTGQRLQVRPHDLRRTYARLCHDAGMGILAIQRNMGHADSSTTEGYIGNLDGTQRRSRSGIRL